ncbi:hypothetical protein [Nonomuraea sp. NPDC003754]
MKPSDFLLSAQQGFLGTPLARQVLDVERVTALRNGPLEDMPDLEATQAIICLAPSELAALRTYPKLPRQRLASTPHRRPRM